MAARTREPGLRGSIGSFIGITALVALGALAIFVVVDPRTLPWIQAEAVTAWSALVNYASGLRPR
ncbi:MAG: hypothetical protein AUH85_12235 [Chloroflexi bacterium 13_1_40CM_4_68_4]|nr:MAG: hypothetical protein AUH85_12235 [Chloroflexi bacterium 13_1_40CM_4_68_4]